MPLTTKFIFSGRPLLIGLLNFILLNFNLINSSHIILFVTKTNIHRIVVFPETMTDTNAPSTSSTSRATPSHVAPTLLEHVAVKLP